MKQISVILLIILLTSSCAARLNGELPTPDEPGTESLLTQSLFNDRAATISEENILKILDGSYRLPQQLRVAIVRLEGAQQKKVYWNYRTDEEYLKTQQSYLDLFTQKFRESSRVTKVSNIPDLLLSKSPSFTSLREVAVRMQADIVVVYAVSSNLYAKYKLFTKDDIKAFATTQMIVLDVRTGLIPFSAIVTKDVLSQKKREELGEGEARARIQNEAVLLTIQEIGQQLARFLAEK